MKKLLNFISFFAVIMLLFFSASCSFVKKNYDIVPIPEKEIVNRPELPPNLIFQWRYNCDIPQNYMVCIAGYKMNDTTSLLIKLMRQGYKVIAYAEVETPNNITTEVISTKLTPSSVIMIRDMDVNIIDGINNSRVVAFELNLVTRNWDSFWASKDAECYQLKSYYDCFIYK